MQRAGAIGRVVGVLLALAWLTPFPAAAGSKNQSKAKAPFENTGVQPDAEGELKFEGKPDKSKLEVKLEGLDPALAYSLACDGTVWADFAADSSGKAKLVFESSPKPGDPMLPGDPRGASFAVNDGSADVLTAILSGAGEPAGSKVSEKGAFDPASLPAGAKVETKFSLKKKGEARYEVKGDKLPAGPYSLLVSGQSQADTEVEKDGGKFKLRFSNPQKSGKELPLDFDPRGEVVELQGPGGMLASTSGSPEIDGLDVCAELEGETQLDAVGGVGEGESELEVDDDCEREFEVEVEDVPAGAYDVCVDGVLRGTIQAAFDAEEGRVEGELEWSTDPDDPGELLLDFDPEGALVEIKQGAVVLFSGVQVTPVPEDEDDGDEGDEGGLCTEVEVEVALISTGALPGASGKAEHETDDDCDLEFEVEIEDVPAGSYDVFVGGVLRGTIVVGPLSEGEGEIEFETDPDDPDELLLDFDPRGQLIEVFDGTTKILERTFPI